MRLNLLIQSIGAMSVVIISTIGHAAEPASPNASPATKKRFDGKTLDGWIQIPADSWVVKDGAMASTGAGRGVIYTIDDYDHYRLLFTMRHVSGKPDHQACVLVFCSRPKPDEKPLDALAGIQFQPPNGGHWDYRKGHNNSGKGLFQRDKKPNFDPHEWSRVELLVNASKGTARMAVAQPVGAKATEVVTSTIQPPAKKAPSPGKCTTKACSTNTKMSKSKSTRQSTIYSLSNERTRRIGLKLLIV